MNPLPPATEARLTQAVMHKIARRRLARARLAIALHGTFVVAAIAVIAPLVRALAAAASQSGFTDYVSLAISDGARLAGSWYPLALSLVESAPLIWIAAVVAALFVCAYSGRKVARDLSRLSYSPYSPA